MKKESTASRLKKIMNDNNLRQVDILNKTIPYCKKYGVKMNKSDISQYCSGKTEPNQDKLFVLGMALNVNEAWLMGFDVPMERNDSEDQTHATYEEKLNAAQKLLVDSGYQLLLSDDDIIIIKTSNDEILCSIREFELVIIYESLIKNKKLSAHTLAEEASIGWKRIDSCLTGKEASDDVYLKFAKNIEKHRLKHKELNDIYDQLSLGNKNRVLQYSKNLLSNQKMEEELAAAHERTDIELTPEGKNNDDAIMDNDSEWE